MREIFANIGWVRKAGVFFGALAILVLVGPFDTYTDLDLWARLVFWSIILSGVGLFMHAGMMTAMTAAPLRRAPQVVQIALGSAAAAVPGAALVIFVNMVFRDTGGADIFPLVWAQVTAIGLIIGLVEYVDWRRAAPSVVEDAPQRTRLHRRLRQGAGAEIVSLTMKDHYVEVTTEQGTEMILLRFSDAVEELDGLPGLQVHRSHWAATVAMRGLNKKGNRLWLDLSDGRSVPVSKTYADAVRRVLAG